MARIIALLCVGALVMAACGSGQKVGSEKLLEGFEEQRDQKRLGERTAEPTPTGSPQPLTVGQKTPSPTEEPTTPPPQERPFDVSLVADSPYYEPGNCLAMPVGHVLRVTNRDATDTRPVRSFTAEDGSFDSGPLSPGQTWTRKFDSPGRWRIVDRAGPFIFAELGVGVAPC